MGGGGGGGGGRGAKWVNTPANTGMHREPYQVNSERQRNYALDNRVSTEIFIATHTLKHVH